MRPRPRWLIIGLSLFVVPACSRMPSSAPVPAHPVADYPSTIDLGKRERGEVAVAALTVANRGGAELVIDQFESNCSCSGLERKHGDEFFRIQELRLKPGEEVEVQMRVSVRGVPIGSQVKNGIRFRTNDPNKPTGQIDATISQVTGGVFAVPESVVIGGVPVGTQVKRTFEVRDDAVIPRAIHRIHSSQERVRVRVLEKTYSSTPTENPRPGVPIARVEVTVDTSTPGQIDGILTLIVEGREHCDPDQVRVIGKVLAPVEVSPSSLILPRLSSEGPVYSANCIVRATDGKPLTVAIDSFPPYLSVTIPPSDNDQTAVAMVAVTLDPKSPALNLSKNEAVRLRCSVGGNDSVIELRVYVKP